MFAERKSHKTVCLPPLALGRSEWQLLAVHPAPSLELIRMSNCTEMVTGLLMLIESGRLCLLCELCYFQRSHILLMSNLL